MEIARGLALVEQDGPARPERDQGWRPLTWAWAFKLSHLFTNDAKPRSIYYAYKEYADLANAGRNAKITSAMAIALLPSGRFFSMGGRWPAAAAIRA